MTKKETAQIYAILEIVFPNMYKNVNKVDGINAWHILIGEYDYGMVSKALESILRTSTSQFPPTPGQLIEEMRYINSKLDGNKNDISSEEAWEMVHRIICDSTYGVKDEMWNALPEVVKYTLRSKSWFKGKGMMDVATVDSVVKSNFLRTFNSAKNEFQKIQKMPTDVRARISECLERNKTARISNNND